MSQASSEQSEGGWIDLFEDGDGAERRLQRRARRDQRRDQRGLAGGTAAVKSEGAAAMRELLRDVELDAKITVPAPKRVKRSRSKAKFAKALQRCGEAPPERWDEDWKEVLQLRYEEGQQSDATKAVKAIAATSADAAAALMNSLDGLTKVAKRQLGDTKDLVAEAARKRAGDAAKLALRVRDEGLVSVVQTTGVGRRLRYGLDDDEDSIFGLDELQELGAAEAALLDALADGAAAAAEAPTGLEAEAAAGGGAAGQPLHPEVGTARLQALSERLDRRREERRRVKML